MRKITKQAVAAFDAGRNWKSGNTEVRVVADTVSLYLHRNLIAIRGTVTGELQITNAGWPTATTKERLNGLYGVSISQKKGVWYLNGKRWDGDRVNVREWGAWPSL